MAADAINESLFPFAKLLGMVVTRADAEGVEAGKSVAAVTQTQMILRP